MSLEQQLMHCLDANLRHRGQVIEECGNEIDIMRDYPYNHEIRNELATALNIYKNRRDIGPSDFDGMKILHTKEAVQAYEQKHGIKSFLFDIELPKEKFKQFMLKVDGKVWCSGLYLPPIKFKGFCHSHLGFSKFGLGLEQEKGSFEHEALHCDKRIYTADYYARFAPAVYNADYPDSRWRAMAELSFAEEMLCFMAEGFKPEQAEETITQKYIGFTIDFFLSTFKGLKEAQKAEKRKQFENILLPVKNSAGYAVKFAYKLKELLPFDILTPLFFSLGPTLENIKSGNFYSPFADLSLWERCISEKKLIAWDIRNKLRKKGYCLEPFIMPAP